MSNIIISGSRFRFACCHFVAAIMLASRGGFVQAMPSSEPRFVQAENIPCEYHLSVDELKVVLPDLTPGKRLDSAVRVSVDEFGHVDDVVTEKSSGNEVFDHLALRASRSAVCKPFPGQDGKPVAVATNFVYSVAGQKAVEPGGTGSGFSAASQPLEASLPPALKKAIEDASLQRTGIEPGSKKADIVVRWAKQITDDPDIRQLVSNGSADMGGQIPIASLMNSLALSASLVLTQNDRSRLTALVTKIVDSAPPDCGGFRSIPALTSRYMFTSLSEDDLDDYLRIVFTMLKQTALHAPVAQVSDDQRIQGEQAVMNTLGKLIDNNPGGAHDLAALIVNPAGTSGTQWCAATRLSEHAMDATPQPFRDWAMIGRIRSQLRPVLPSATPSSPALSMMPAPASVMSAYAQKVQRRIRPNIVWSGSTENLETVVEVHCLPNGTIDSLRIVRSSGNTDWDAAALRAIQHSDPMPVDTDGHAPVVFKITMRPGA